MIWVLGEIFLVNFWIGVGDVIGCILVCFVMLFGRVGSGVVWRSDVNL